MIEGTPELNIIHNINSPGICGIEFFIGGFSGVIKLQEDSKIIYYCANSLKIGNPMFMGFDFFQDNTGPLCIRPEIRVKCELFSFF